MSRILIACSFGLFAACVETPESPSDDTALDETASELSFSMRACTRHTQVIGLCGNEPNLLVACTKSFTTACSDGGGTIGPAVPLIIYCEDGSDLFHDCDMGFKADCSAAGGTFIPTEPDGSEGKCKVPDAK